MARGLASMRGRCPLGRREPRVQPESASRGCWILRSMLLWARNLLLVVRGLYRRCWQVVCSAGMWVRLMRPWWRVPLVPVRAGASFALTCRLLLTGGSHLQLRALQVGLQRGDLVACSFQLLRAAPFCALEVGPQGDHLVVCTLQFSGALLRAFFGASPLHALEVGLQGGDLTTRALMFFGDSLPLGLRGAPRSCDSMPVALGPHGWLRLGRALRCWCTFFRVLAIPVFVPSA